MLKHLVIFLFCFSAFAETSAQKPDPTPPLKEGWGQEWIDVKESFVWLFKGSYLQFTQRNNLYYAAVGVPTVWYSFEEDKRLQTRYGGTEIINLVDHVGDMGVILNFPLLHAGFYYYGKKTNNNHHVQFAKEYFASMYLALAESGIFSYVNIHHRPETEGISFWESEFRGNSSWPSGHIVPYATLTFKTLQFYGPYWASLPLLFTVMSSMQRVQDKKHWVSDVTASFFLSAFASEGVRAAAGYKKNHPVYKAVFEHDLQVGVYRYKNVMAPRIGWSF